MIVAFAASAAFAQEKEHEHDKKHEEKGASKGEVRIYLADKDKKPVDLAGVTATLFIEPKGGTRKTLKLEAVSPKGEKKLAASHGGDVVAMEGYQVEFVVVKEHGEHAEGEKAEHHEKEHKAEAHEHGDGTPYFKADVDLKAYSDFSAAVIFKIKGETKNAKGFQYPPAVPKDYKGAVSRIEEHLKQIDDLIKANDLEKVHAVAEKISQVCEKLPALADKDHRALVEKTSKEVIALFKEIDEAADAGKKAETVAVANQYKAKVAELKKHAGGGHQEDSK
jgi:hypothetical protein